MKNILNEVPQFPLYGRLYSLSKFIDKEDIKNKKILDLGCGFGWFEYYFGNLSKEIIALEMSEKDLKTARENIKSKNIKFITGSGLEIPIKNNIFDMVLVSEVIEHIPKNTENKFLKEINRVLKKDGVLYLTTPFKSFWSVFFDPAWWLIGHRHYSLNELKIFGKENGFKFNKCFISGGWWSLVGLLDMYIAKWIFGRKKFFNKFIEKKETEEFLKPNGFMNIFVSFKKK